MDTIFLIYEGGYAKNFLSLAKKELQKSENFPASVTSSQVINKAYMKKTYFSTLTAGEGLSVSEGSSLA